VGRGEVEGILEERGFEGAFEWLLERGEVGSGGKEEEEICDELTDELFILLFTQYREQRLT
jgi:hypothetical protein